MGSNFTNCIEVSKTMSVADICCQAGSIIISIATIHPGEYFQFDGSRDNSQALAKDDMVIIDSIDNIRSFVFIFAKLNYCIKTVFQLNIKLSHVIYRRAHV
ncbi:MAG: hypothetical protein WCG25_09790 [bacterium]